MNDCEGHEADLSALVDGELEAGGVLPAIDHLAACASCRGFYLRTRALDSAVRPAAASGALGPAPARLWREIRRRSGLERRGPITGWRALPVWAWGAAAAVILVAVLFWGRGRDLLPGSLSPPPFIHLRLEEERGQMSVERFVELTAELLRADRRYQRKMYEVLGQVQSVSFVPEGSSEGRKEGTDEDRQPAEEMPESEGNGAPVAPRDRNL